MNKVVGISPNIKKVRSIQKLEIKNKKEKFDQQYKIYKDKTLRR